MNRARFLLPLLISGPAIAQSPDPAATAQQLPDVVISETRTPRPLSQVGSSVTVITGAELRERQITQVIDALREVPGLAVNLAGSRGAQGQVRIRGAEGNHTLVLLDGVKLNDPDNTEFDISQLTTDEVERIEVIRGPQSMVYGADAAGGVINIVSRRGQPGRPRITGLIEGGSQGTSNLRTSVSGGGEAYDYNLYGGRFGTSGTVTAPGGSERDGYRSYTVGGRAGLRATENLAFEGSFRHLDSRGETDGQDFTSGLAIDTPDSYRARSTTGRGAMTLNLFDGRLENIFAVSGGTFTRDSRTNGLLNSRNESDRLRTEYQANIRLMPGAVTTFGLDWQRETNDRLLYGTLDRFSAPTVENAGFWAQQQIDLFDRLALTAGIRRDENDFFGSETTYRFTAAYRIPATGTKIRGAYGTGFAPPSFGEMYFVPSASFVPNTNLKPERTEGWEVGIDQDLLQDRLTVGATYFQNRVHDFIAFDTASFPFRLNNIGTNQARGVELSVRAEPASWASVVATYTLTDSEIVSSATPSQEGLALIRRPRNAASLNLTLRPMEKARVNLGVVYNGTMQDSFFGSGGGRRTLAPYTLARLAVSYEVAPQVQLVGRIENAFDQKYQEVYGFEGVGRAAYAGLRFSY